MNTSPQELAAERERLARNAAQRHRWTWYDILFLGLAVSAVIYFSISPASWLLAHAVVWAHANYILVILGGVAATIASVAIAFVYLANAKPN